MDTAINAALCSCGCNVVYDLFYVWQGIDCHYCSGGSSRVREGMDIYISSSLVILCWIDGWMEALVLISNDQSDMGE